MTKKSIQSKDKGNYSKTPTWFESIYEYDQKRKSSTVLLCISLALFLVFIGFFAWYTATMRNYELNYVKIKGTIVDVEADRGMPTTEHSSSSTAYYLVISYTFEGKEYKFRDGVGYNSNQPSKIGTSTEIYVNPQNPNQAEKVTSASYVSITCAVVFAFFCLAYSAGMNILLSIKGSSFKKRLAFVWGIEILLAMAFVLLFWLGLPNSGFGQVFARIQGAVGLTVISGLVLLVALLDALFIKLHIEVKLSN